MNVDLVSKQLGEAGGARTSESVDMFDNVSLEKLSELGKSDEYAGVVERALVSNSDFEVDLYLHQYLALYELAKGNDVLLIYPCGSGKTRVMENAPQVVKFGFEVRTGKSIKENPLGIVCCPLSSIMEEKIGRKVDSGMLSMHGGCKLGANSSSVTLSREEDDFFSEELSHIYGHPESFSTEMGKRVLESNEHRIYVFVSDELGFNVWGQDIRILMSTIPAALRVFSDVRAPMLCMSATVGKSDQEKVLEDMGMKNRKFTILEKNPVMPHVFIAKLKCPSNQRGFMEAGGLRDVLSPLILTEFISDPLGSRKTIIFFKNEEDLIKVYDYLEQELGEKFSNLKTRPWIQYHGSMGSSTLGWVHQRIKSTEEDHQVKLYLSTYKLVMGVDIQDIDIAIFIRYINATFYLLILLSILFSEPQTQYPVWFKG